MTETTPETPIPTSEQLIARYQHLEQIRAACVDEQEGIKAQLRARFEVGKHETPAGVVTVSVNRRFDPALFTQLLGDNQDLVAACSVTKVDSSKAKRVLPPATYEACMKPTGDPTIRIS